MQTELTFSAPGEIVTDLLVVLARNAQPAKGAEAAPILVVLTKDCTLKAVAESILSNGEFKAAANETLLLHSPAGLGARRLLIVGVGRQAGANQIRNACGTAVRFCKPRGIRELAIVLPESEDLAAGFAVRIAVEGALLGDYDADTYRTDRIDTSIESLTIAVGAGSDREAVKAGASEGVIVGESQTLARSLVNEPGNKLTPTLFGERAAAMAADVGLGCEVHSTEKLHELKMGAFWSVSQGSDEPPALIVLRYEPEGVVDGGPVLGLVGKGITFDAGGISIKPSSKMEMMKDDMAGGAAMMGAMRAIALLKPAVRVIAIICAAENMPGGKAQKPGDVQTAMPLSADMPGKTIEIINTDAEGRLVLADGLTYARRLGATHLVDAATLTGAVIAALGHVQAGIFSNNEDTYKRFRAGMDVSGENFWRLPLGEEYAELMHSDIADVKNSASVDADASSAAELLHLFVEETPWIHLDIAGMAWTEEAKPYMGKGPTGFGVRSILEWARQYAGPKQ